MFFSVQLKIVLSMRFRKLSHLTVTNLNYGLKKCRALNTGFPVLKSMKYEIKKDLRVCLLLLDLN